MHDVDKKKRQTQSQRRDDCSQRDNKKVKGERERDDPTNGGNELQCVSGAGVQYDSAYHITTYDTFFFFFKQRTLTVVPTFSVISSLFMTSATHGTPSAKTSPPAFLGRLMDEGIRQRRFSYNSLRYCYRHLAYRPRTQLIYGANVPPVASSKWFPNVPPE